MNNEDDWDVRLDPYGQPDINYYIVEARRMRAKMVASWFSSLKSRLIKRVGGIRLHTGAAASH